MEKHILRGINRMHPILRDIVKTIEFTKNLKNDIFLFLTKNQCPRTAEHCMKVGEEARCMAIRFNANPDSAEIAGWLHDISAVFPNQKRIEVSEQLELEILPEELEFPMIIHQKISRVMARDIFGIEDEEILDAVGCHTTLRGNATLLDRVLFVADKIAWDQDGIPPYLNEINEGLTKSLDHGAFEYIHYLWERRDTLRVVHPWLVDAYKDLIKPFIDRGFEEGINIC
jgi:predicted HD superfamily hydrolase involved in NAD metabolism